MERQKNADEIFNMRTEMYRLKTKLTEIRGEHEGATAGLRKELARLKGKRGTQNDEELAAMRTEHNNALEAMQTEHSNALALAKQRTRDLRNSMHSERKRMQASHEEEISNLRKRLESRHEVAIATLKAEHERVVEMLTEGNEQAMKELKLSLTEKHAASLHEHKIKWEASRNKELSEIRKQHTKKLQETEAEAEKKFAVPHAEALKENARLLAMAEDTQKKFRAEADVRKRLDNTLSQLQKRLHLASSMDQTDFLQNNLNPKWKEELELPVLIPSDGIEGNVHVLVLSQLQADDLPDMDASHRSTSDPYAKCKLIMGVDNSHELEIQIWDKNWKKDDQLMAQSHFKVPSYYTNKKGNFIKALQPMCESIEQPSVSFKCQYEWTECHLSEVVKKHAKKKKKRSAHNTAHKIKLNFTPREDKNDT